MQRVAIIGLGLMGGSLALALNRQGSWQITGWDANPEVREQARLLLAGIRIVDEMAAALQDAGIVVLAIPVRAALNLREQLLSHLQPGTILTDICSTKGEIEEQYLRDLPPGVAWLGGHPMAGSEKWGLAAAREDLFREAVWFLCPGQGCQPEQLQAVIELVRSVGAREHLISARDHDRLTARLSHLPHLVAGGLLHNIACGLGQEALALAGPGLKDTTRIAGSQMPMWLDICLTNRSELCAAIDDLQGLLQTLKEALLNQDEEQLIAYLNTARALRQKLK